MFSLLLENLVLDKWVTGIFTSLILTSAQKDVEGV